MIARASCASLGLVMCAVVSGCGAASSSAPDPPAVLEVSATTAATSGPVAVSPQPGTPDASPQTQISFLGPAGLHVSDVHVIGSRSGPHGGLLRAYSTGTGASFLPAHSFAAGERVSVSAKVAAGQRVYVAHTSFTIAYEAPVSQKEFPLNAGNAGEVQRYSSAPGLTPSAVRVTTPAQSGAAPGDLFLAPYQGDGTAGPMIADQSGNLIWFHPVPAGESATSLKLAQYEGKPVLAWWQGRILEVGFGQGEDVLYNTDYQKVATVRAGNGYSADLHEFQITPEGTAWIDIFDPVRMNLSRFGGLAHGTITDSVIEEIDVKTGLVMWEWHALGHVAISDSHNPAPRASYPWDYVHINSISVGSHGDVLLSSRNTWALYDVDIRTGGVRWRIGGDHSSFRLGPGTRTYWQHDAEFQPGGLISIFDNGSDPPKEKQSRGVLIDPDLAMHTVTLVKQFVNPSRTLLASSQGNLQSLPRGDWLMGYGGLPNFTEYDSSGRVLLDGSLGRNARTSEPTSFPGKAGRRARPRSWPRLARVARSRLR